MDINSRKHCRLYRNQNPLLPLPFPEVNPSDALMEKWAGNEKSPVTGKDARRGFSINISCQAAGDCV
jgi:hypothetical protein